MLNWQPYKDGDWILRILDRAIVASHVKGRGWYISLLRTPEPEEAAAFPNNPPEYLIVHGVLVNIPLEDPEQALPRVNYYALSRWGVGLCKDTITGTLSTDKD